MNSETKTCQKCSSSFVIDASDFAFYKKIDVPPPTWCPECRNIRRLSWREDRTLYRGICALCKRETLSMYAPGNPFTIYCYDCWISDKWDQLSYGRDYDFNTPFFLQYRKLMEAVPRPALTERASVNCKYCHACMNCKNCYFLFWGYHSEDCAYGWTPFFSRKAFDSYITDNSEQTYETVDVNRLYRVGFGYFSDDCLDSSFLFNCVGCSRCFGCVNLRKQKYCVFNEQLTKEGYEEKMRYWDMGSYARLCEAKQRFRELYLSTPHRYAHTINSTNSTGDVLRNVRNCTMCFSAFDDVQNCKYIYFAGFNLKDSYDQSASGEMSELLYECSYTTRAQRSRFCSGQYDVMNVEYCDFERSSSNLFGCISLRNKRFCILNKQYTKEEYEKLVPRIKKHMEEMPYISKARNSNGEARNIEYRYGEFFPPELSAFAYNESFAFVWYPKTKEEVLREGLRWQDPPERTYKITQKPEDLPDHIKDASDALLKETIGCMHAYPPESANNNPHTSAPICNEGCATAFRLTAEELAFYRDMHIALPRLCPNCRHAERLKWRNGFRLYKRRCQCGGETNNSQLITNNGDLGSKSSVTSHGLAYANTASHPHGGGPCPNEFETTYQPERPEIVYCDQCYKAEFL